MDLSPLLSTIDETAGLARLREALSRPSGRGKPARAVAGVNDAAKPATLAALVADEERPVLILTGRPARAEVLADELAAWLGPAAGDTRRVLFFPERDALPYERLAPDRDTVRDRLNAVIALTEERPYVIAASVMETAQQTLSPDDLARSVLDLRPGQKLEMCCLARALGPGATGYVGNGEQRAPVVLGAVAQSSGGLGLGRRDGRLVVSHEPANHAQGLRHRGSRAEAA